MNLMLTLEQDSCNRIAKNNINAVWFIQLKKTGPHLIASSYNRRSQVLIQLSIKSQWCGKSFDLYRSIYQAALSVRNEMKNVELRVHNAGGSY